MVEKGCMLQRMLTKADRPFLRNHPHKPTDYRSAERAQTIKETGERTDGWTDASQLII